MEDLTRTASQAILKKALRLYKRGEITFRYYGRRLYFAIKGCEHDPTLEIESDKWSCPCTGFALYQRCYHVVACYMALAYKEKHALQP